MFAYKGKISTIVEKAYTWGIQEVIKLIKEISGINIFHANLSVTFLEKVLELSAFIFYISAFLFDR